MVHNSQSVVFRDSKVTSNRLTRLFTLFVAAATFVNARADELGGPGDVATILAQRCADCHGADLAEGDVRLDAIAALGLDARLDLLNRVQEQLFLQRMPPEDEEQLTAAERVSLESWVSQELHKYNAAKFEKKLQKPEYGNYVDHDKLFSGEFKELPGFTYDRRWLISEYIFNAKFQRMLQGNARAKRRGATVSVLGSHRFQQLSLTNPFLLPNRSGVRYYADTDLTGGHLSSMLTNAQKASEYITDYLVKRKTGYLPAIKEIMALVVGRLLTKPIDRRSLIELVARHARRHAASASA